MADNAFPIPGLQDDEEFNGLTKREYFAIEIFKALQTNAGRNGYNTGADENMAIDAIEAANALLKALSSD